MLFYATHSLPGTGTQGDEVMLYTGPSDGHAEGAPSKSHCLPLHTFKTCLMSSIHFEIAP